MLRRRVDMTMLALNHGSAGSEGVQDVWITDTVLSRRRPPEAHIVPVAPLLARVLEDGSDPRRF